MSLKPEEKKKLEEKALQIRRDIINVTYTCGGAHVGGALSQTDIMVALYYHYMKFDPKNPRLADRDRFILSKGHGGVGHAAVLADVGFFPKKDLDDFNKTGSPFGMHLDWLKVPGVDASTGSLGHGLSIGVGMAYGAKLAKKSFKVYCMMGDGELHGGPIWEAAMSAAHFNLNNLIGIVDRNQLCIDGSTEDIMALEPIGKKWEAFNWNVITINGHDYDEISDAIEKAQRSKKKPTVIIANTKKGAGVDFMECQAGWHYGGLDDEMRDKALASLKKG